MEKSIKSLIKNNNFPVLLFGKKCPPVGGVTIHIERLHRILKENNIKCEILDYSKERHIFSVFKKINNSKIVHLHLSKKKWRLLFVLIFKLLRKKVLITFHGNYNFENIFDVYSLKLCHAAITLNKFTFTNSIKVKSNYVFLLGAFLPPTKNELADLEEYLWNDLVVFRENYKIVLCTNASDFVIDENGDEIYQGTKLMKIFEEIQNIGLVFSDPTGNYKKYFQKKKINIPLNVLFITENHSFIKIIGETDGLIRYTTTDGDSISVREALYLTKTVFASNIVDRPKGVILFKDDIDLKEKLKIWNGESYFTHFEKNSDKIIGIYQKLAN